MAEKYKLPHIKRNRVNSQEDALFKFSGFKEGLRRLNGFRRVA